MIPAPKLSVWRIPVLLALSVAAIAAAVWFPLRAAASSTDLSLAFIGWLALVFLAATITLIVWSASCGGGWHRTALGDVLLAISLGVVVLCLGAGNKIVTVPDTLRLCLLLSAWLALCSATATLLRRVSPSFSIAATLSMAMFFFTGPVAMLPLLRIASPGSAAQQVVTAGVAAMTPMLAALDGIKGSVVIEWAQLPQIYHLTTVGQDLPMVLPSWWQSALLYGGLALASAGCDFCIACKKNISLTPTA